MCERALQKKFYESRKRTRGERSQTSSAIQDTPLGKRSKSDEEAALKLLDTPLWRKTFTMMTEAEVRPEECEPCLRCNQPEASLG